MRPRTLILISLALTFGQPILAAGSLGNVYLFDASRSLWVAWPSGVPGQYDSDTDTNNTGGGYTKVIVSHGITAQQTSNITVTQTTLVLSSNLTLGATQPSTGAIGHNVLAVQVVVDQPTQYNLTGSLTGPALGSYLYFGLAYGGDSNAFSLYGSGAPVQFQRTGTLQPGNIYAFTVSLDISAANGYPSVAALANLTVGQDQDTCVERYVPQIYQTAKALSEGDVQGNWFGEPLGDSSSESIGFDGCAITSLCMVIRSLGITTTSDGQPVDPKNLNDWLKAHNGYGTDSAGEKTIVRWDKVYEYTSRQVLFYGTGTGTLDETRDVLKQDLRSVLRVAKRASWTNTKDGHHFVVPYRVCGDEVAVCNSSNDGPGSLSDFFVYGSNGKEPGKAYSSRLFMLVSASAPPGAFMYATLACPAEFVVTSPSGAVTGTDPRTGQTFESIPGSSYWVEGPSVLGEGVTDPDTWVDADLNHSFSCQVSESGDYKLTVIGTGLGRFSLSIRGISATGKSSETNLAGFTDVGVVSTFRCGFSMSEGVDSDGVVPLAKPGNVRRALRLARKLGEIDNRGVAQSLQANLDAAVKARLAGNWKALEGDVNAFLNELSAQRGKHVTDFAADALSMEVRSLLE